MKFLQSMIKIRKISYVLLASCLLFSMLDQILPQSSADNGDRVQHLADRNQTGYRGFSHKIDTKIIDIMNNENHQYMAYKLGTSYNNGRVAVYVHLNKTMDLPPGLEITARDQNIAVVQMTLGEMNQTSQLDNVVRISLPDGARYSK
jgi:hypothetical protein